MNAPAAFGPRDPHDRAGRRLASLDLLRGLTVLGMILANATAGVRSVDKPVFALLLHSRWAGFTIADAVFPAFIVMVGVSIAIGSRGATSDGVAAGKILWRAARLVLIGLLLTNMFFLADFERFGPPRLPGVLQRIGIVYAATALLYARTGWRVRAGIAAAILILYWPLALIPSPDGTPTDLWVEGHNFVSWADRWAFGSWRFVKGPDGYDPEGLLSTLPTVAEALIGTLVGDFLRRGLPVFRAAKTLAITGVVMLVGGLWWGLALPIAKNIWSSSFVLLSAGLTILLLAGFHAVADRGDREPRRGGLLGSFGRNAIAAYVLHEVGSIVLTGDAIQLPYALLEPMVGSRMAALAPVLIFVAAVWAAMAWLDRKRWYLKI